MRSCELWTVLSLCLVLGGVFTFGAVAAQQSTASTCGLPVDGTFTGKATYELKADCDLSGGADTSPTWNVAADAEITIVGNGYSLIGGSRGSGSPPFEDATFLTIITGADSTLALRNIVLDSVRMRIGGKLIAWHLTYTGARNHGIFVEGNADFECALFEDNLRKTGHQLGSALTSLGSSEDGAVRFYNTDISSNLGGAAALVSLQQSPFTFEGCLTRYHNTPKDWHPPSSAGYITNEAAGQCSHTMGASKSGDLACRPPTPQSPPPPPTATPTPAATPTPLPTPTPTPTPNYIRYEVCPGDNLFRISINFCVPPEAIIEINGLRGEGELLSPGQELIIPVEVDSEWIVEVVPYPPREDGSVVHIVGKGQTLSGIAEAYRVELGEIIRLNNLPDDVIIPGQELLIRAQ